MTEAILTLKDVRVSVRSTGQGALEILHGLNLKVLPGDFITIIGNNGAGKSTLFNTIAGVQPLTSGHIYHRGQEISRQGEAERSKFLARVFQDPKMGTAPRMTVAENMLLASRRGQRRSLRWRQLRQKLPEFTKLAASIDPGLAQRMQTATENLSGGQRQTLSFLMATLKRPDILLLDEHTAALDPSSSRNLLQATNQRIQQEKLTALMITHHLQDALDYGNRLLVLKSGKIVADFKAAEKAKLKLADLYNFFDAN
jgi:putative ABC transport system ATP-binding protein